MVTSSVSGDIISIESYKTRLPVIDPTSSTNQLYGLVDMGSNGIRFSISDLAPPHTILMPCIYRERAGISLYDALHESNPDSEAFHFSKTTIDEVSNTLARFKRICDDYQVPEDHVTVFATEAMRTAKNRDEMLESIKSASGLDVLMLSPPMESFYGAMGARSGFSNVAGLFMDLGGGSVQMTYLDTRPGNADVMGPEEGLAEAAKSMPFGAAKLTAALSSFSTAKAARSELKSSMTASFESLLKRYPPLVEQLQSTAGVPIYFCGGGFRGYGSMLMYTDPVHPYPIPAIGGYTVPGNRFVKWQELLKINEKEQGKIFGLSKRRREQFPAIVEVIKAIVEAVPKIREVTFCSGGNREGVLYTRLPNALRQPPIHILPGGTEIGSELKHGIIDVMKSVILPSPHTAVFTDDIIRYICRNIWHDMGNPADANAAKALHRPISGSLAGLPGMTHQDRAIIALILSARWGNDLGPADIKLRQDLEALVGDELSFWCEYIGTVARVMAEVIPCYPSRDVKAVMQLFTRVDEHAGKKGHKVLYTLYVKLNARHAGGLKSVDLSGFFSKVGKGLRIGWRADAVRLKSEEW